MSGMLKFLGIRIGLTHIQRLFLFTVAFPGASIIRFRFSNSCFVHNAA